MYRLCTEVWNPTSSSASHSSLSQESLSSSQMDSVRVVLYEWSYGKNNSENLSVPCEQASLPLLVVFGELRSWHSVRLPSDHLWHSLSPKSWKKRKWKLLMAACFVDTGHGCVSLAGMEEVVLSFVLAFFAGGGLLSSSLLLPSSSDTSLCGGIGCGGGRRKDVCQRTNNFLNVVAALGPVHVWQEWKMGKGLFGANLFSDYNNLPKWIQLLTNAHIVQLDWRLHKVSTLI